MIRFVRHEWNQEAADYLAAELAPDTEQIKAEVEKGIAHLWQVPGHGWVVTRRDEFHGGTAELVVVAIRGQNVGPMIETIKAGAKRAGLPSVRFHSSRTGAGRYAKKWGFEPVETVHRCYL